MTSSGRYSNSGARGKDFQNLIFSKKEKELWSRLSLFSPKIMVISKKKRSSLQFDLWISYFAPKSRCSLKKNK